MPFRWREPTPSHARRRIPARAYPRRSERMVAIGQPSTDSIMCPLTQEPTGLLLPPRAQPRCQKIGLTRFEQAARKDLARRRRADQSWHSLPLQRKRSEPTRNQAAKAANISRPAELGGWKQQGPAKGRARHPSCRPEAALGEPVPHPQTRHEAELWGDPAPKTPHTYSKYTLRQAGSGEGLNWFALLLIYPGARLGYERSDFELTYRKIFFGGQICMANRVDPRSLIQSKFSYDRVRRTLIFRFVKFWVVSQGNRAKHIIVEEGGCR